MKLSILDQAPISTNMTASQALKNSIRLAELGDTLGYTRFWLAEHHGMDGLSSSAPEVTLGAIGMVTENIRLGSGATLLPYYKPYKIAEIFNTLATLYGSRIDIGIGRAPGGGNEASEALSDNYLSHVFKMPDLISDLQGYISQDIRAPRAMPVPEDPPELWMLGTSAKSAAAARDNKLNYCFGQFMSENSTEDVLANYRANDFGGKMIMTINVFCHEDNIKAESLAYSYAVNQVLRSTGRNFKGVPSIEDTDNLALTEEESQAVQNILAKLITGTPEIAGKKIKRLGDTYKIDEFMIVTITHDFEDKVNSYRLLAEYLLK